MWDIKFNLMINDVTEDIYLAFFVESSNNFAVIFNLFKMENGYIKGAMRLGNDSGCYPLKLYLDDEIVELLNSDLSNYSDLEKIVMYIFNEFKRKFSLRFLSLTDVMTSLGGCVIERPFEITQCDYPKAKDSGLYKWTTNLVNDEDFVLDSII